MVASTESPDLPSTQAFELPANRPSANRPVNLDLAPTRGETRLRTTPGGFTPLPALDLPTTVGLGAASVLAVLASLAGLPLSMQAGILSLKHLQIPTGAGPSPG
jgi:hypothetical protein